MHKRNFLSVLGVYMLFLDLKVSYEHPFYLLCILGNNSTKPAKLVVFHILKIMPRCPKFNLQQIQAGPQIHVIERPAAMLVS
jgi:hypothetical protein